MLVIFSEPIAAQKRCNFFKKLVTKQVVPQWILVSVASRPATFFLDLPLLRIFVSLVPEDGNKPMWLKLCAFLLAEKSVRFA
jgi:hypothetical protein